MTENNNDILVEIPDNRLSELATFYKNNATWAPYMFTFMHTAMKWKKSDKYKKKIIVLSPNNSWEVDGTVIILTMIDSNDIHVFTLEDDCSNLYKGLSETKRIKYDSRRYFFYAVHEKHILTVKKLIEEKNLNLKSDIQCFLYALPPEDAKKLTLTCPSDVTIKKLQPLDAKIINSVWPHRFENSDKHIGNLIEINGGYGIFLKETNELVAWVVRHVFGNLTMVQTDARYKKNGYGSLVAKALAKEIGEEGYCSICPVVLNNNVAMQMFEKLGFRAFGRCSFITVE